jgi:16S rRNA (guanine(966)-N(2))-methyltransferase RsmD
MKNSRSTHSRTSQHRRVNSVRIGGGQWRSRLLSFPDADGLRPTGDRVKQTLFNWLGQSLVERTCLDAFAGSGALGFEAASRGAQQVVLCEANGETARSLTDNADRLGATQCKVVTADVRTWLRNNSLKFDVAFCDPPFSEVILGTFLEQLVPHLAEDALVYIESAKSIETFCSTNNCFVVEKASRAGAVHFGLLRLISAG